MVKADLLPSQVMQVNAGNIGQFIMEEAVKNEFINRRVGITNRE